MFLILYTTHFWLCEPKIGESRPHTFFQRLIMFPFSDKWSPALQIRTVLLSIQALLSAPNPDDPLANDVAELWKVNEAEAIRNAKEWTRTYAMGN